MKPNSASLTILMIVTLAVTATAYRVSTAPERIRQRQDSAKATCLSAGGEWVKVGRDEICRLPTEQKKN